MKQGILLFTDDIESARAEIEDLGGVIAQQFTDHVIVANLPDSVRPGKLEHSSKKQPDSLDEVSKLTVDAWKGLQVKARSAPGPEEGMSWDSLGHEPPDPPDTGGPQASARAAGAPQKSTGTPTSLYLTGSVAVGVVVVSGTQNDLTISSAEFTKIIQEVQEGLDFLANAEPRAKLSFVYDIRFVSVSAQPGNTSNWETAEAPWRNAATQSMGYSADRQGSRDYVNDLRNSKGTDWAFVGYFTKYPLWHFAYAVEEKTVMHYGNDGWGTDLINRVFAHEACHIFGAADEYGSCSCGGSHGYLGVANNNCVNCPGTQEPCLMSGNVLQMCPWSRRQVGWDESLFPGVFPTLSTGNYTIQQVSSDRYLDAHESSSKDFSVVTRKKQSNNTQRWRLTPVGTVYTIQQVSNARFLDAYTAGNDYNVVTRPAQHNDTQRWVLMHSPVGLSTYTIQQLYRGRYLDAWETPSRDHSAVTRRQQNNDTQRWVVTPLGNNQYTLQHLVNGRYLDAHESSANDYSVVTRTEQNNDTQRWLLTPIGGVYTIQQRSNGRFVDAWEASAKDYDVVTRSAQNNASQNWVIQALGDHKFSVQQLVNGRYLDAHESSSRDFRVVTRTRQNNDTQRWEIRSV